MPWFFSLTNLIPSSWYLNSFWGHSLVKSITNGISTFLLLILAPQILPEWLSLRHSTPISNSFNLTFHSWFSQGTPTKTNELERDQKLLGAGSGHPGLGRVWSVCILKSLPSQGQSRMWVWTSPRKVGQQLGTTQKILEVARAGVAQPCLDVRKAVASRRIPTSQLPRQLWKVDYLKKLLPESQGQHFSSSSRSKYWEKWYI